MKLKRKQKRKIFFIILGIILLISMYLDTYLILKYNVLPFKYLIVYGVIVGLIPILLILYTVFKSKKSKLKGFAAFVEIIYIIVLLLVFFYLNKTFNFLDAFTHSYNYETKNYYIISLKNSDYDKLSDLKNAKIGYAGKIDSSVEIALEELNKKVTTSNVEVAGYGEMFEKLDSKDLNSVLIVQSYYDVLLENDENMHTNYKIVERLSIKEKVEEVVKDVDVTKGTFNIYITGIDSYGSVTETTRSDVNIIMSINPNTHKILLVSIPRDYFVELVGDPKKVGVGNKDKLTHAGSYGVETSIKTIEKLLDFEINYYVKVNYNALIDLVDALGGVDVYSEYEFKDLWTTFKKGYNHVDGHAALEFARARKSFRDGDRVRGENQQRMIEAILKKVLSPSILIKYGDLLKAIEGNFATNLSTEKITSLINMQLDKMPKWDAIKMSLNGSDAHEITYSFKGQELYVMIPNEETVEEAKAVLKNNQ